MYPKKKIIVTISYGLVRLLKCIPFRVMYRFTYGRFMNFDRNISTRLFVFELDKGKYNFLSLFFVFRPILEVFYIEVETKNSPIKNKSEQVVDYSRCDRMAKLKQSLRE